MLYMKWAEMKVLLEICTGDAYMKERLFDQKQQQKVARSLYNAGEQGRRKKRNNRNDGRMHPESDERQAKQHKSRQNNKVIKSPRPPSQMPTMCRGR